MKEERRLAHSALDQLEIHAPLWVCQIRDYIKSLEDELISCIDSLPEAECDLQLLSIRDEIVKDRRVAETRNIVGD